ncbi:MAG: DNA mismatch repair endonuclease MutH [Thioalkalispiraceae bacterium]|jgi:DNA mismatch repair protein MutH
MITVPPPVSQDELLIRIENIAGFTLAELAATQQLTPPSNLQHAKGWAGQLIETSLGASAGSRAEPDFPELGIELKTIPLTASGQPKESTYVCSVPLNQAGSLNWEDSWVRRKLNHVLWLPIEADPDIPIAKRRIGTGMLRRLTAEQDAILKQDWEEHMELINTGRIHEISAHHGTYLQVRPKAADRTALRDTTNEVGEKVQTLPRGFYLRTRFTAQILAQQLRT